MEGYSDSPEHGLAVRARISHVRERIRRYLGESIFYLDDRHNILSRRLEFAHIDIEMVQLVAFGCLEDNLSALAHGVNAAEIGGGVQCWVGRFRSGHFWNGDRRATALVTRRSERSVGGSGAVSRDE